ncbi:MAG: manganese-binding transcriptional regulator MntR [Phycisphaerales bacterium JB037]
MPPGSGSSPSDRAQRFRTTRQAHADETAEDYVEAVGEIIARRGECRVRDLAAMMGVSHVTVSRIIARLCELGLVRTEPYRPIELTLRGERLAARARQRHEQVVAFLRAIGVSPKQAEIDAEGIEHHVSRETLRAMDRVTRERTGP